MALRSVISATLVLASCAVAGADGSDLAAENARLKRELADLREKCGVAAEPFSFFGAAKRSWGIGGEVVQHLLGQTEVDDKLAETAAVHYGKAKALTADVVDKVSSVDYANLHKDLQAHPVYVQHVAPHVETVAKTAQPYVDQYVSPALEKANVHLEPALKTAKETFSAAEKKIREDVVPELKRQGSKAYDTVADAPTHVEKAQSALHNLVSPVFDTVHRVAPEHSKELPRHPVDRLLLLIVCLFVAYHLLFWHFRALKITYFLTKLAVKLTWLVFRMCMIPFYVAWRIFCFFVWVFTLFGCCGKVGGRSKAKELATAAEKQGKKNGSGKEEPKTNGSAATTTAAEISDLLEAAKKEGKLEAAAKELVKKVKSGQALTAPKKLKDKKVTKDACTKAFAKFKELDTKKLGL